MHDHILVYQKTEAFERNLLPRTEKQLSRYQNLDDDPRGIWSSDNYVSNKSRFERPTLWYPIKHPKDGREVWPDENAVWRYSREKHEVMVKENRLYWGPNLSYEKPRIKRFLSEIKIGLVPNTWWTFNDVGHNDEAQKETAEIIGKKIFSTPKPVRLVKRIVQLATSSDEEDIVLDFFAGSGVVTQAVMEFNKDDGGNRQAMLVQIPEKTDEDSETYKAGLHTIADIGKERIRRAIKKIKGEVEAQPDLFKEKTLDLGFKVFTLEPSNFKIWRTDVIETEEELKRQMEAFVDPVRQRAEFDAMAWEILLKSGYELTTPLEKIEIGGAPVYSIAGGELVLLLEAVTQEAIDGVIAKKPKQVICLDRLFAGNDQLKTNTALQMKDASVEFRTI
jgi:adenine-specific DNA-methyltransferase